MSRGLAAAPFPLQRRPAGRRTVLQGPIPAELSVRKRRLRVHGTTSVVVARHACTPPRQARTPSTARARPTAAWCVASTSITCATGATQTTPAGGRRACMHWHAGTTSVSTRGGGMGGGTLPPLHASCLLRNTRVHCHTYPHTTATRHMRTLARTPLHTRTRMRARPHAHTRQTGGRTNICTRAHTHTHAQGDPVVLPPPPPCGAQDAPQPRRGAAVLRLPRRGAQGAPAGGGGVARALGAADTRCDGLEGRGGTCRQLGGW